MPMRIVIPHLNHNSTQHLKFCLRSIAKYLPDAEVTVIGDRPFWAKNITHVGAQDQFGIKHKERNIYLKLLAATMLYPEFLVVHDDHYFLSSDITRSRKLPGTYNGNYKITMANTFALTGSDRDHDVHRPFMVDYEKFSKLESVNWDKDWGYGVQTLYCEMNGIKSDLIEDIKINWPANRNEVFKIIEDAPSFSTGDIAFQGEMRSVLLMLFPHKCRFEL